MRHCSAVISRILASARCAAFAVILPVLLAACATPPRPQLTPADQAEVDRIAAYLNSIPRFEAHFIQYGSFGPDAGTVWLDRPAGHLRIDYTDAERRVMVIADGQVLVVDRSTGATTTMPVSRTPLGMLLTPTINLSGPITVASLARLPGMVQITLEKTGYASQGNLMLTFADRPLRLIAVAVTDAHGRTLTMRLSGIDTAPALTPALFQPPPGA
ncbi:LolA family protein [Rhodopila globiformis]|uniref:LolA family protein n=1 Tax=Rhodopila globiformis TaxID=1071 RepID=UPI001304A6E1|nr:outer membrane lipoprotein carrier protein LolA [Rhodopila globiformis]